jgi:hypothetical protein
MRTISKALVLVVGLLSIGVLASSVFADGSLLVGTFKLTHSTQWNSTLLPAGEYQFKLTRSQTGTNMLVITGQKQTLNLLVLPQNVCDSCKTEALRTMVQGDTRIVTSLDLPGYHLDFKVPRMEEAKETTSNSSAWIEQVAVHANPAN